LTIAPAYLGVFVWAPFFDSLWIGDITRFRLELLIGSAVLASLLCYGLLFQVPASWGLRTGRALGIIAASTFGTVGSEWITGIAVGAASIVWYAVAIDYAVDSTLLGLRCCRLITIDSLRMWDLGPIAVKSPVFLCTALFWIYITGMAGLLRLARVIVALMRVYAPIILLLLTAVALWLLPSLGSYRLEHAVKIADASSGSMRGNSSAIQLVCGFFAMAGLVSVDWGARVQQRRDLALGGLTGVVLAASWTAAMSLIVVAGTVARLHHHGAWFVASVDDPVALSFRWGVFYGIGGVPGSAILIVFGLAALAPACYSVEVYGQKLSIHWPRLGQSAWTWIGGALAFALAATSVANRLDLVFSAMGDVFAPAVGAIVGDWLRQRGEWAGLRPGINRAGVIAWGAGVGVALVLEVSRGVDAGPAKWSQPTSIYGFVTSVVVYWLLTRLERERTAVAMIE
jgi:cytosine permease